MRDKNQGWRAQQLAIILTIKVTLYMGPSPPKVDPGNQVVRTVPHTVWLP